VEREPERESENEQRIDLGLERVREGEDQRERDQRMSMRTDLGLEFLCFHHNNKYNIIREREGASE
jgi:hypothetical protein